VFAIHFIRLIPFFSLSIFLTKRNHEGGCIVVLDVTARPCLLGV
jgi:hypothetical protein